METEARKLLDVISNQASQGSIVLDSTMLGAMFELDRAVYDAEIKREDELEEDVKSARRERARAARLERSAPQVDTVTAMLRAYGPEAGTVDE